MEGNMTVNAMNADTSVIVRTYSHSDKMTSTRFSFILPLISEESALKISNSDTYPLIMCSKNCTGAFSLSYARISIGTRSVIFMADMLNGTANLIEIKYRVCSRIILAALICRMSCSLFSKSMLNIVASHSFSLQERFSFSIINPLPSALFNWIICTNVDRSIL